MFAQIARIDVVVDDGVDTSVTLRMRNIPWDLALYHLAQKYELRIVRGPDGFTIARR